MISIPCQEQYHERCQSTACTCGCGFPKPERALLEEDVEPAPGESHGFVKVPHAQKWRTAHEAWKKRNRG